MDQVVADLRPFKAHGEVADVVAHAGGARREDREVSAALALELELRALDRGADFVVGHFQAGTRRQRRLILDRLGLILAEAMKILGFGRVMAVAIDDHGAFTRDFMGPAISRTDVDRRILSLPGLTRQSILFQNMMDERVKPAHHIRNRIDVLWWLKGESMAELPRLNSVIKALESGKPAFTSFCQADPETAIALATAKYDGVVYEMEHNPWDIRALRDSLQYMLNRGQIAKAGSVAPAVTPMVRIPPNGAEKAQFHAKQALDLGAYGIVWPHISSVEEAYNAVAACRYPRLKDKPLYEPQGIRGDGPTQAVRYWGVSQQEYYDRADVWPLNPKGEIFVILMMEDMRGIEALPDS